MRKLVGGLAILSTPLFAMALLTGCQNDETSTPAASANEQEQALISPAGEKAALADEALEACGFKCKVLADGDVSISGVRSIDAFFGATVSLQNKAALLKADVTATLGELAAACGAEVGATAEITAANIKLAVEGGFDGNIEGAISIKAEPPKCSVTASATVEASAKCDASVEGGKAEVKCEGSCSAEASAMATCEGELKCTGTAPSFKCEGSCSGSCQLEAGGECSGECKGDCKVDVAADCDGEFTASTEAGAAAGSGTCKSNAGASCKGTCTGSCELKAAATCSGKCEGECEYTPPEGGCSGSAKCEAKADAKVSCSGECNGTVEPPKVAAECEATAKADAQMSAECTPPSVGLDYTLKANGTASASADAKAEFAAKLEAFGKAYGKLLAKGAQLEGIFKATAALPGAAAGAVADAATKLGGSADVKLAFDMACTAKQLPLAGDAIVKARADIEGSVKAIATVTGSVGG